MPILIFYRNDKEVLRLPLIQNELKIGRHPSNDLTLPDEEISRFHSSIQTRDDGYWLTDQSRNGTFLNGRKVESMKLTNKDEIGIGHWKVVFSDGAEWGEVETAVHKRVKPLTSFHGIIGQSEVMRKVFSLIEKVAPTDASVLIIGDTGVGKELIARAVHELSTRSRMPFVAINCGAISPHLVESELFGHERGAFTGAVDRHRGAFEQADGGTLFLDEVGELPLPLQPKFLRVLEEHRYRRVGGTQEVSANVRILAATHRNLQNLIKEGKFREDLYFRLHAVPLIIPSLRERTDDIPLLSEYFLAILQNSQKKSIKTLSSEALQKLMNHPWRGNVRELRNVLTRSLLFSSSEVIQPSEILFFSEEPAQPARPTLQNVEREAILNALKQNNWNKKKTAESLGLAKSTLFHKIREYDLNKEK